MSVPAFSGGFFNGLLGAILYAAAFAWASLTLLVAVIVAASTSPLRAHAAGWAVGSLLFSSVMLSLANDCWRHNCAWHRSMGLRDDGVMAAMTGGLIVLAALAGVATTRAMKRRGLSREVRAPRESPGVSAEDLREE